MKLAKEQTKSEQETQKKSRKKKSALAGSGEFTEAEENLFKTLRKLRAQIAKEEKVPPYIVFSDKTLAHMCIIKPVNKEEMLSVSGVGEFKYEKYGERFLAAVRAASVTKVLIQGPIKRNTKNCSRKNTGIPLRRSSAREVHRQVCIFPLW